LLSAINPPEAEFPDLAPPEFANYEVLEVIGHGGMGIVYKARQRNTERIVALKVILTGALAGETEVRRFRREAQAVAKLRHPNIVTLFEVGHENGQHFYSMEYVEGESLLEKVRRNGLGAEEAARILRKVSEAVEAAHQEGILHRDLKPANILIDKRGEPRITDFGLAQQRVMRTDLTRTGMVLGTPSYMPPEQATGKTREIGVCSDVYSLGATLYEALTGRPPFQAESAIETLRQVVEIPPAAPRLLNPKLPRDLEVICFLSFSNMRYVFTLALFSVMSSISLISLNGLFSK
jgi:serine/threonine protein kinase